MDRSDEGAKRLDELAGRLVQFPNRITEELNLAPYMDEEIAHRVKPASDFQDELIRILIGEDDSMRGTPLPWNFLKGKFEFRSHEMSLWTGFKGHGKALDVSTAVPTPSGWKTMGGLNVGDQVFDENGKPCNVIATTDVMHERKCYRIRFSDGTEVIADANHQWLTECYKARMSDYHARRNGRVDGGRPDKRGTDQSHKRIRPTIRTTEEISLTLFVHENSKARALNHAVAVCGAVQYPAQALPVDPYLLGFWLGDGRSDGPGLCIGDDEIVDVIGNIAGNLYELKKHKSKFAYRLNGGFGAALASLGLIGNKHIPDQYFLASAEQRLELLRGLMDSDGHINKDGRVEFCNTNYALASGVVELCASLGIVPTLITGTARLYGKDCGPKYRVCFTSELSVFKLTRKLARVRSSVSVRNKRRFIVACDEAKSVPVRCIQVDSPSSLFLVTRSFIPTHNSALLSQALNACMCRGEKVFIISPEFRPARVLERLLYQKLCTRQPVAEEVKAWLGWASTYLWLYDAQSSLKPRDVIALCRYAARELGVQHILIDSLMKCGIPPDDWSGQKQFVDQVQGVAHQYPLHMHLVAHARKGHDDEKPAKLHDVKGTSEIADMAENVLSVWRNKPKEKDRSRHEDEPDAILTVEAQRNGDGWIGALSLYFDPDTMIFFEPGNAPERHGYVNF